MNCYQAKAGELAKQWYIIDAEDKVVGRLAAQIAPILMGKHRPTYTPHIDTGDYVIVTNVDKVVFTGNKWRQKFYQRYSGYPGGQTRRGRVEVVRASARADPRAGDSADDAQEQDRPPHDGQAQALSSGPTIPIRRSARSRSSRCRDVRPRQARFSSPRQMPRKTGPLAAEHAATPTVPPDVATSPPVIERGLSNRIQSICEQTESIRMLFIESAEA